MQTTETHAMNNMGLGTTPAHSKISFTAKGVALARSVTDIPFAADVSELLQCKKLMQDFDQGSNTDLSQDLWLLPFLEVRYKALVAAIKRLGIHQVLELASGVALRGLAMTLADPKLTYVETDLPELTAEKKGLIADIRGRHQLPPVPGFHVGSANVLSPAELDEATSVFDPSEPIAVIHEGLFMYLSRQEQDVPASNIHGLLARFGGVWITPDFSPLSDENRFARKASPGFAKALAKVVDQTGRNFKDSAFADDQEIAAFCDRHGFQMDVKPQIDGSFHLSSIERGLAPESSMEGIESVLKLWEMRFK